MKKIIAGIGFIIFLMMCLSAKAAASPDVSIASTLTAAMTAVASQSIMPQAILWLGSFMSIQFIISNVALIKGDNGIDVVIFKFMGNLLWFGFCYFLLENGPSFIDAVGNQMLSKFAANVPTPGSIIAATLSICTLLLAGIAVTGTSIAGVGNSSVAMVLVYVLFILLSIGVFMAVKIFMLQLELGLIVMLSPLSFSFLGLNALKDQGIAPLKSLISLVYRIVLLGILYGAFGQVLSVAGSNLQQISWANPAGWAEAINIILAMLCSFPMLAYLVYKSDSIAASLAGGSTNLGTSDIASAAAVGAAAGAAMASGGASLADAAAKVPQSMGDVLKNLMGGGGSVSNASGRGVGEAGASGPSRAPSMSAGPSSSLNAPPQRPQAATGSSTAPSSSNQRTANGNTGMGNEGPAPARPVSGGAEQTNIPTSDHQGMQSSSIESSTSNPVHDVGQPTPVPGSSRTETSSSSPTRTSGVSDSPTGIPSSGSSLPADASQPTRSTGSSASGLLYPPGRSGNPNTAAYSVPPSRNTGVEDNAVSHGQSVKEGSGATAGISGAQPVGNADPAETSSDAQTNSRQPRLGDHLKELNKHFQDEKASTHVSINLHGSD